MDRDLRQRDAYIAIAFGLIFVAILCIASFVIARPFLAPLLWASSWRLPRGRLSPGADASWADATLAAMLMTVLLAVVLLGPLALIGIAMTDNVAAFGDRLRAAIQSGLGPPDFLAEVPLIGSRLTERWREFAADGKLSDEARQMLRTALQWLFGVAAALGGGIAQLALSIFCAFFFSHIAFSGVRTARSVVRDLNGHRFIVSRTPREVTPCRRWRPSVRNRLSPAYAPSGIASSPLPSVGRICCSNWTKHRESSTRRAYSNLSSAGPGRISTAPPSAIS